MPLASFLVLTGLSSLWTTVGEASCLPDSINASQRRNLTGYGESYPIGVLVSNWDASYVTSAVVHILLEEQLGYNVFDTGPAPNILAGYYALLGCATPHDPLDRGCGPTVTYNHIVMEAWSEGYASEWNQIQTQYASMAPVDVGSMGYDGVIGTYLSRDLLLEAYHGEGLVLGYYKGWNASWNQPNKYFHTLDVNRSDMMPCNQTTFFQQPLAYRNYLAVTGDANGVQEVNGELVAVCPDDYFWLPPVCRDDASRCVPYFTAFPGWGVDEVMQKFTSYNMPVAVGVAREWSQLSRQVKSLYYWWVPDTTFVDMDPVALVFPPYDFKAFTSGDKRSSASSTAITKMVSQDLATLAPTAENFVRNVRFSINDVMDMLRDMRATGDSHVDVACRWLRANPDSYQSWLPDRTKCFPGFGLYDTNMEGFADSRADPTFLECRACVSGRYSSRLDDAVGITYKCELCDPGSKQSAGAAMQCDPCHRGEYQNLPGSHSCNRCNVGEYQDQTGAHTCLPCPGSGTTLGFGSVSLADCGCPAGFLHVGESLENLTCAECGEGLECPILSTLSSLVSGDSDLGRQFVATVRENFYSSPQDPLGLYRCIGTLRCPGGIPGSCTGGLQGMACTDCPAGQTWNSSNCERCTESHHVPLLVGLVALLLGLIVHYMVSANSNAKPSLLSVLAVVACTFGMIVSTLQSLGIVGLMTVEFPAGVARVLASVQIFLLDIDAASFGCVAGTHGPTRYIVSVLVFPVAVLWLVACHQISKLSPKHQWKASKTKNSIGAFLQIAFTTMSTISTIPFMCFSHPNGVHSILKFPSITCGTQEHTIMLAFGFSLLLVGVFGFLAVCAHAVIAVPSWSASGQHQKVSAFQFLFSRFRFDRWWFGVCLLARGPLMSLPIALATDFPPIQVMSLIVVFLVFIILEAQAWPWKVPFLNVLDCCMGFGVTMLLVSSAFHVGTIQGSMREFADGFSSVVIGIVGCMMGLLFTLAMGMLLLVAVLGGQREMWFLNLQRMPPSAEVSQTLQRLACQVAKMEEAALVRCVETLSVYDVKLLMASTALLSMEVLLQNAAVNNYNNFRIRSFSNLSAPDKPEQHQHITNVVASGGADQDLCSEDLVDL